MVDESHQSIATSVTSTMQLYHNQDGSTIGNLSDQKKGLWSTENTSWGIHVKKMTWDAMGLISCMWIGPLAVRFARRPQTIIYQQEASGETESIPI